MHVIGRRHVTFVTGAVLAAPIACRAQTQQKLPVVGILNAAHGSSPEDHAKHPFVVGLRELGWEDGKDFHFATAYGEGRVDRLPELAAALVAKKVDVIVTGLPRDCSPLAVYKRLEHLLLLPALPRNPVGMVHKRDLRDLQRVQTA